jgi:tellurite resistance protein TehA-like permease
MWDSQLVSLYNVVSGMYLLSYVLIVASSIALRFFHTDPVISSQIRSALLSINLFTLIISLGGFEIKSMIESGLSYLDSFWNKNDVMLFCMSIVCLVQEFLNLNYQKKKIRRKLAAAENV